MCTNHQIEYNLIQKLFLTEHNIVKFIKYITTDFDNYTEILDRAYTTSYFDGKFDISDAAYMRMLESIEFESEYDWSIKMKIRPIQSSIGMKMAYSQDEINHILNIYGMPVVKVHADHTCSLMMETVPYIFIGICPVIKDDYAILLRTFKAQIRNTLYKHSTCQFYVLVKEFASTTCTKEEILKIYTNSGFMMIMVNDLFVLDSRCLTEKEIQYYKLLEKVQDLEIQNEILNKKITNV